MEMTRVEKFFVNREEKGQRNTDRVATALEAIDVSMVRDVLEIGCGIGTVAASLARDRSWNLIGSDADPRQIDTARVTYPESNSLRFEVQNASNLRYGDMHFDLVVSQNVFHHIPNWPAAVAELCRVLRPNGYVLWYDLAAPAWFQPVARRLPGVGAYTHDAIERVFIENGFACVRTLDEARGFFRHRDVIYRKNG